MRDERPRKAVNIIGFEGLPAMPGSVDSFGEQLGLYLMRRGWSVTFYTPEANIANAQTEMWEGIRILRIPDSQQQRRAQWRYRLKTMLRLGRRRDEAVLALTPHGALFHYGHRPPVTCYNGHLWQRKTGSLWRRCCHWLDERLVNKRSAAVICQSRETAASLKARKTAVVLPSVAPTPDVSPRLLEPLDLTSQDYVLVTGEITASSHAMLILRAFLQSRRPRTLKLVFLTPIDPQHSEHKRLLDSATEDIVLMSPIPDPQVYNALLYHARYIVHGDGLGHELRLVLQALAAGNALVSFDMGLHRNLLGNEAVYFEDGYSLMQLMSTLNQDDEMVTAQRKLSAEVYREKSDFTLVLRSIERILERSL